jgi:predicted PurR-regulated permease PerM
MSEKTVTVKRRSPFAIAAFTIGLILFCLAFWHANSVFLLLIAGALFAIFLEGISSWIARKLNLHYRLCLILTIIALIAIMAALFAIATPLIAEQLSALFQQLPKAFEDFRTQVNTYTDGKFFSNENMLNQFIIKNDKFFSQATEVFSFTINAIAGFFIFALMGLYLSYDPKLYVGGLLQLVPSRKRAKIASMLKKMGMALRAWLIAKFISMSAVGILTMIGLTLLGIPLAFILALLVALFAFVPYIGPIVASLPAILIGLSIGPYVALYVTILYLFIHALEGYLITPYLEQTTVSLPPALTIFAQLVLVILFGFLGILLASPITLLTVVAVKELYVKKGIR